MKATISSLSRNGIKYDILTPGDLRDRYPMLSLPPDYVGVFDYSGGVLRADKALRAFQVTITHLFARKFNIFNLICSLKSIFNVYTFNVYR